MPSNFEPRLLAFICDNYLRAGAGLKARFPFDIRIVKVACSHCVEPEILLEPILANFDGVLILECLPGDCRYAAASDYSNPRFQEVVSLLYAAHIQEDRLYLDRVPVGKEQRLSSSIRKRAEKIKNLGPLHLNKAARERLRMAQNNFETKRIRKLVVSSLIQVNAKKVTDSKTSQFPRLNLHDEYIKNWLAVLIEESPITLQHISEVIDIGVEHISKYLLTMEKEHRIHIPTELRQGMFFFP